MGSRRGPPHPVRTGAGTRAGRAGAAVPAPAAARTGGQPGDEGQEPDYRFTLANERTFLAWLRTALALDAAGIAIVHLLPELLVPGLRELAGLSLVALGAAVAGSAYARRRRYQQALRLGRPLPASRLPAVLVVVLSLVSAVAVVLLVAQAYR